MEHFLCGTVVPCFYIYAFKMYFKIIPIVSSVKLCIKNILSMGKVLLPYVYAYVYAHLYRYKTVNV